MNQTNLSSDAELLTDQPVAAPVAAEAIPTRHIRNVRLADPASRRIVSPLSASRKIAAIENLSIIAARLSRQHEKEFAELRDLQAERKERESTALDNAFKFSKSYEVLGKTYDPAEDGFRFFKRVFQPL